MSLYIEAIQFLENRNEKITFGIFDIINFEAFGSFNENEDSFYDDDKSGTIKGVIIEETTGQGMEYANIAIYSKSDSSLVTGGITDEKGEFEIKGMEMGEYYLEAQFIGFEKSGPVEIVIDKMNPTFNLGNIKLSPSAIALESVDVVADKAAIEYKLDKKVVNVSQVISAAGIINLVMKKNSRLQIQGFYRGPSASAQGETKSMFYSNFAYRHDFMKKKLTATVSIQDPFRTANYAR